jgi:hypothetical protein
MTGNKNECLLKSCGARPLKLIANKATLTSIPPKFSINKYFQASQKA